MVLNDITNDTEWFTTDMINGIINDTEWFTTDMINGTEWYHQ